jgi:hypothetical protein
MPEGWKWNERDVVDLRCLAGLTASIPHAAEFTQRGRVILWLVVGPHGGW